MADAWTACWPSSQALHETALYSEENVPSKHSPQVVGVSLYVPGVHATVGDVVGALVGALVGAVVGMAAHSVQRSLPAVHVPLAQVWHQWYLVLSWYLPDGQWKQLVLAVHALYVPAAHLWQELPEEGWYWPIGQSRHEVEPAIACFPSAQSVHVAALYTSEYVPMPQSAQRDATSL